MRKIFQTLLTNLQEKAADVVYEGIADIHVSGHARQEELKLMLSLIKPKYFMPVHGEYVHLLSHRDIAVSLGIPKENIFVMNIGDVLELSKKDAKVNGTVPAGQVLVDGLGVGDVGNIVLRDRKNLSGKRTYGCCRYYRFRFGYNTCRSGYNFQRFCICQRIRGSYGGSQSRNKRRSDKM